MKSISDCLESIQNGEHEKYPYLHFLNEYVPTEQAENMIRVICQAQEHGLSTGTHSHELALAINYVMRKKAESMSQASVTPFDNDTNIADLKREM